MKLLALGGAIQGAMVSMPAAVSEHLPEWVLQSASVISFLCIIAAGLGIGKDSRENSNAQHSDAANPGS